MKTLEQQLKEWEAACVGDPVRSQLLKYGLDWYRQGYFAGFQDGQKMNDKGFT